MAVTIPPPAPSARWFSSFFQNLISIGTIEEAVKASNLCMKDGRTFGRINILDVHDQPLTLSLAVEGGGRQLRKIENIDSLRLSEHGDWRKIHMGAFESNLGRRPYSRHILPMLDKIYHNPELRTLKDFNSAIFEMLFSFLMEDISISELEEGTRNPVIKARGKEISNKIDPDISLIDAITAYGKETLIALI